MLHVPLPVRLSRTVSRLGAAIGLAALAASLSCSTDTLDPNRTAVASVVVAPSELSVGVGSSAPLSAEVRDGAGALLADRKVVWASKNVTIATVSGSGAVTGVMNTAAQIASFVSSVAFGYLVEHYGNYYVPFYPMVALLAIGTLLWLKVDPTEKLIPKPYAEPVAA